MDDDPLRLLRAVAAHTLKSKVPAESTDLRPTFEALQRLLVDVPQGDLLSEASMRQLNGVLAFFQGVSSHQRVSALVDAVVEAAPQHDRWKTLLKEDKTIATRVKNAGYRSAGSGQRTAVHELATLIVAVVDGLAATVRVEETLDDVSLQSSVPSPLEETSFGHESEKRGVASGGLVDGTSEKIETIERRAGVMRAAVSAYLLGVIAQLDQDYWPQWVSQNGPRLQPSELERPLSATSQENSSDAWALDDIVACTRRLVILGASGSGKTWASKRIARQIAERSHRQLLAGEPFENLEIPLWLTCAALATQPTAPVRDQIVRAALASIGDLGHPGLLGHIMALLDNRSEGVTVVMDSIDEAPQRSGLAGLIARASTIGSWRVVFTTRPGSWQRQVVIDPANPFHQVVRLAPLEYPDDVEMLVSKWFRNETHGDALAKRVLDALARNRALASSATVPLVCAMLCLLAGESAELPTSRRELYDRVAARLLRGYWRDASVGAELDVARCRDVLEKLALSGVGEDALNGLTTWNPGAVIDEMEFQDDDATRVAVENLAPHVGAVDPDSTSHPRQFIHRSIQEHFVATARCSWTVDELESFLVAHLQFDTEGEDANVLTLAYHHEREAALGGILARMGVPDPSRYSLEAWDAVEPSGEIDRFLCLVAAVSSPSDWPTRRGVFEAARRRRAELGDADSVHHLLAWTESNSDSAAALLEAMGKGRLAPTRIGIQQIIDIDADLLTSGRALTAALSFLHRNRATSAPSDEVAKLEEAGRSVLVAVPAEIPLEPLAMIAELLAAESGSAFFDRQLAESVRDSSISASFIDDVLERSIPERAIMASYLARTPAQRSALRKYFLSRVGPTGDAWESRRWVSYEDRLWRALALSDPGSEFEVDAVAWSCLELFGDLSCAQFLLRDASSPAPHVADAVEYLSNVVRESTERDVISALQILARRKKHERSTRALGERAFRRLSECWDGAQLLSLGEQLAELGCQDVDILERLAEIARSDIERLARREAMWFRSPNPKWITRAFPREDVDEIASKVMHLLWEQISAWTVRYRPAADLGIRHELLTVEDRPTLAELLSTSIPFLSELELSTSIRLELVRLTIESLHWCVAGADSVLLRGVLDKLDAHGALNDSDRSRAIDAMLDGRYLYFTDWDRVIRFWLAFDSAPGMRPRVDPFSSASEELERQVRSRPEPEEAYHREFEIEVAGAAAWGLAQATNRETEAQELLTALLRGEGPDLESALVRVVRVARVAARDLADRVVPVAKLARTERWSLLLGVRRGSSPEEWDTFYRDVASVRNGLSKP